MTEKKRNTLRGSTAIKIVAFFLMLISFAVGVIAGTITLEIVNTGMYERSFETVLKDSFADRTYAEFWHFVNAKDHILDATRYIESACDGTNLHVELWAGEERLWGEYEDNGTPFVYTYYTNDFTEVKEGTKSSIEEVIIKMYVDDTFLEPDSYWNTYQALMKFYEWRQIAPAVAGVGLLLAIVFFVFLMYASGHKNGREGIVPSLISWLHLDVYTVIYIIGVYFFLVLMVESVGGVWSTGLSALLFGGLLLVWTTIYAMEVILRMKQGEWWKHTLLYDSWGVLKKIAGKMLRGLWYLIKAVPMVINVLIVYFAICIIEFFGLMIGGSAELAVLWGLEKIILLIPVIYIASICKKLQQGSEALAQGNLSYQVDTSKMFLDFKEHGENLNCIGEGMAAAVEQRMKSERLKTELITNVSHDIKTPLTSIINYADLIGTIVGQDDGQNADGMDEAENVSKQETLQEYADVLLRQSKRLKKLLDNLLEASKASSGALEVNLESCQLDVLLSQAVGEYEKRLEEKQLELITRWPQDGVKVKADGRHMWRIFDNLLNNICKYAQEGSRVYLTIEEKEKRAEIIFRNMSKYPLDIGGEELQERFVRGDKSRHMEGNGLGLSIAQSLVQLQNGEMTIVTDGDLFKVTIAFRTDSV
ncbi:MAG: sensor histidine kinase [Lachnospiraceae bacterium]|nr:sensor histidine kinase [Lachnospiraceae bacterium]